jgi:hypothetical protein
VLGSRELAASDRTIHPRIKANLEIDTHLFTVVPLPPAESLSLALGAYLSEESGKSQEASAQEPSAVSHPTPSTQNPRPTTYPQRYSVEGNAYDTKVTTSKDRAVPYNGLPWSSSRS